MTLGISRQMRLGLGSGPRLGGVAASLRDTATYRWRAETLDSASPTTWTDVNQGQVATITNGARYLDGESYTDAGSTSRTAVRDILYLNGATGRVDLNFSPAMTASDGFSFAVIGRYWTHTSFDRILGAKDGAGAANLGLDLRFNTASNLEALAGDGTNVARTDGDRYVSFPAGSLGMAAVAFGASLSVWSDTDTMGASVARGSVADATPTNTANVANVAYTIAALPEMEIAEILVWDQELSFSQFADVWAAA